MPYAIGVTHDQVGREIYGRPFAILTSYERAEVNRDQRVIDAAGGHTKLDLVRYYQAVEGPILAALGGRATMLQRFPDGAHGKSFFQKRVPAGAPDWLQTTEVATPNGTTSNALVVADLAHLVWAVQIGCLGFHPWPYLAATPDTTDELRIDLDPSPGVTFDQVREAAIETRTLLDELGVASFVKTSGSKGLHVYAALEPRWDSYDVRRAAVSVARALEERRPDLITGQWWKEERGARVFVDFNQNAPHKTVFGTWCVRPRVGGQVSSSRTRQEGAPRPARDELHPRGERRSGSEDTGQEEGRGAGRGGRSMGPGRPAGAGFSRTQRPVRPAGQGRSDSRPGRRPRRGGGGAEPRP